MKSDRPIGRHYMGHQCFVSVVDSRLIIVSPLQLLRHTPARWYTTQFTYVRKTTTTKKVVWTGPYITSTNLNLFFFFFFPCVAQTDAPYCPWKKLESVMCKLIRYYIKWTARKEQQQPDVGIFLGWATMKKKRFRRSQQILSPLHTRRVWRSCLPNCFHSTHLSGWCCWQ